MQLSVIIPSYNRAHTLPRALNSVFTQTLKAREVIVVDDGSSDDSVDVISRQFPQVQLLQQSNQGVSAARNHGIAHTQSEWIAFLDSDDEWLPDKLAEIAKAQTQHSEFLIFHSDEIWIRNGVRVNAMNKHRKSGGWIYQHCLPLCVISPSAVIIHRSIFDAIGCFNESLPACEDYDLWLRLCHRYPVHYIDQPLIRKYGGHEDQLSRKYWGMDRFRIQALQDVLTLDTLNDEQRASTEQMLKKKLGILLKGARKHDNRALIDQYQPLLDQLENRTC